MYWSIKTSVQDLIVWTLWFIPFLFLFPLPLSIHCGKLIGKKSYDTNWLWYFIVIIWCDGPHFFFPEVFCESNRRLQLLVLISKIVCYVFFNQLVCRQERNFLTRMIDCWDCICRIRQTHYLEQHEAKR